jgi:uncharacterized protein (DUF983 family)
VAVSLHLDLFLGRHAARNADRPACGRLNALGGEDPFSREQAPIFLAAIGCRCPRCGRGRLFAGFLTVASSCPVCRIDLGRMDSGDGPAVFLIFIIGFLVVPLAIWTSNRTGLPDWAQGLFWGLVILGLTIGLLRPAKALVLALNYRHRTGGPEA